MSGYDEKKKRILNVIKDKHYKPLKQKELAFLLQVEQKDREEFRQLLAELVKEGKVLLTKRGKYQSLLDVTKIGVFCGHQKGFGFVSVEDEEEDYFIPESATLGAMHGDKVMLKIMDAPAGRRKEAQVTKILEHRNDEIVGYYQKNRKYGFVIPDNQKLSEDIYIPAKHSMGAVTGHKVVVKLTRFATKEHKAEGKVIEILGHVNDPGTDILSIVRAFNLQTEFPRQVIEALEKIPEQVSEKEIAGRLDLREMLTVTIDGEDAKDLDDAITLTKNSQGGYELGVHIADVTHYVGENSPLDKEALSRGTSVYLVDRVIPMLPHKLSNGICSLNAKEDRLALSCMMDIDADGKVKGHRIVETVIRVDRRMSYNQVDAILKAHAVRSGETYDGIAYGDGNIQLEDITLCLNDGKEIKGREILEKYKEYIEYFCQMKELSERLRRQRKMRGSIDFDFPEAKICLTEDGEPVEIGPYDRNPAHRIIEDFMLAANETVAEDYFWQEIPFEFRVHGQPDPEKVDRLSAMMERFGYYFKTNGDSIHPKEFQKLLEKISGTPEEGFLSRMTLRTMQQAKYATECSGHFGLAAKYYCHFTSPIRRYPDLQIHRIIKENLAGGLSGRRLEHYSSILNVVAESNSRNERRAQEAEREVEKLKKVQYMSKRLGKEYDGIISGVTAYGFYVELANTIEGMVRISTIADDFYIYDERDMSFVGKEYGRVYTMGQQVRVRAVHVDKLLRIIDFELVDDMEPLISEKYLIV